jgi:hypothetical protein
MVFFALGPAMAGLSADLWLRRTLSTPRRKSLCGLAQHKKSSFIDLDKAQLFLTVILHVKLHD